MQDDNYDYDDSDPEYQEFLASQTRFHHNQGAPPRAGQEEEQDGNEQPQEPELSESIHNNGQGIRYNINFTPQLPPPAPNEKYHANARAPLINLYVYLHEKLSFAEVLDACITAIGRNEHTMRLKIVGTSLRTDHLTVTWTIRCTDYKQMQLQTAVHFKDMIQQGAAEVPDDRQGSLKKRKVPPEEEELAEIVVQLQQANRCHDRACTSRHCFIGNTSAQHVRLTPIHINVWAAAILAKMPNVNVNTPPPPEEEKMFWPVEQQPGADGDDIAMLPRRRATTAKTSAPQITINNDYTGLATLLQPLMPSAHSNALHNTPSTPLNAHSCLHANTSPAKPAQMTFAEFGASFKVSAETLQRLAPLELDGPHVFEFVENSDLDAYLTLGQHAALRYAHSEWKKGKLEVKFLYSKQGYYV
ncbi:hypothetical protein DFH07DRAFT_778609 [Mycena maculata]|uniref:Uncharacterized protein n=1 Tax=Mycena maculata TaxID=230809 RepID=A0AAD7N020_9AGAR|nr:hypothetical protein DFH07DRAFT_778609 [Mycena maculata]